MMRGEPIDQARVKGAKSIPISYSKEFEAWSAAVAAGATLDELLKWDNGGYPTWFMARVIIWHKYHEAIELHREAAANTVK